MTPECQAMIERAIDAVAGSCRQWRTALDDRHMRSLSAALDVAHGYQPGEGGWWLDRMTRLQPLQMDLSPHPSLYLHPLVLVHRQVFEARTVECGLWLREINVAFREIFEEHARDLPRRLLLKDFRALGRRAPVPRVRPYQGTRLPGLDIYLDRRWDRSAS